MTITWKHYKYWLKDLIQSSLPEEVSPPHPNIISTDTRKTHPSHWFIPLKGENFDGHNFILQSLEEQKVSGVFCEKYFFPNIPSRFQKKVLVVNDTLLALQAIARGWRAQNPNIQLFAITGSVGKTTCKNMLYQVLAQAYNTFCSPGNFNNEIGVPLSLLDIQEENNYGVLEFGARKPGDITLLNNIALPNYVACLNVGSSHYGVFGGQEQIYRSKLEIISSAPKSSLCIVNHDDQVLYERAQKLTKKIYTFGVNKKAHVHLKNTTWNQDNTMTLVMNVFGKEQTIKLSHAHQKYPYNALAVTCLSHLANIDHKHLLKGLLNFTPPPGRFHLHQTTDFTVIDDSYNASIESVESGFISLKKSFPLKKKIVILGDLLELGTKTIQVHTKIGKMCGELIKPSLLITVGKHAKIIADTAAKSGLQQKKILHFPNVDSLLKENLIFSRYGSLIYTKGSHAIGLEKMVRFLLNASPTKVS